MIFQALIGFAREAGTLLSGLAEINRAGLAHMRWHCASSAADKPQARMIALGERQATALRLTLHMPTNGILARAVGLRTVAAHIAGELIEAAIGVDFMLVQPFESHNSMYQLPPRRVQRTFRPSFTETDVSKKKTPDLFGDDETTKPMNEFERLLNSSGVEARGLSAGDRFRGEILAVSGQEAFISTGTPTDAVMPLASGAEKPKAGDFVDVIVVRAREGEILVKPAVGRGGSVDTDSLEDAFDMEIPVEGLVTEAVKGGFRVKVQGVTAFCPISQLDWRVVDAAQYVGRKYEFIITKFDKGRDLVVSRRKLLEQERAANEGEFQQTAQPGDIFTGTIFRIEKYGAFVRLSNGIDGLIPVSEMSWNRINHPQEVVNLDQSVQVKLLSITEDGDRLKISFSLKAGGGVDDPWQSLESAFPVGSQVEGTVEHKEAFGIFVRIAMGVTGLLPRSAWRDSTEAKEYENKRKGDKLKVRVARIDLENRKLSLALPGEDDDESWREHTKGAAVSGKGFGSLGDLLKNVKVGKS